MVHGFERYEITGCGVATASSVVDSAEERPAVPVENTATTATDITDRDLIRRGTKHAGLHQRPTGRLGPARTCAPLTAGRTATTPAHSKAADAVARIPAGARLPAATEEDLPTRTPRRRSAGRSARRPPPSPSRSSRRAPAGSARPEAAHPDRHGQGDPPPAPGREPPTRPRSRRPGRCARTEGALIATPALDDRTAHPDRHPPGDHAAAAGAPPDRGGTPAAPGHVDAHHRAGLPVTRVLRDALRPPSATPDGRPDTRGRATVPTGSEPSALIPGGAVARPADARHTRVRARCERGSSRGEAAAAEGTHGVARSSAADRRRRRSRSPTRAARRLRRQPEVDGIVGVNLRLTHG